MKLPRVRFTVRRMMAVAAIVSIILCGENIRQRRATDRRRESYQRRAAACRIWASQFRNAYETGSAVVFADPEGPVFATTRTLRLRWAMYFENLTEKYEAAASRP